MTSSTIAINRNTFCNFVLVNAVENNIQQPLRVESNPNQVIPVTDNVPSSTRSIVSVPIDVMSSNHTVLSEERSNMEEEPDEPPTKKDKIEQSS